MTAGEAYFAVPRETEVAIVGGGIAGVATAYFLAKAGVPVAVFEKGRIAGEQSSRNWGWVRKQGRDPRELPAIVESLKVWEGLERELEADIGWHRGGVTYLGESEAELAWFERWLALAKPYGLDSRMLTADETDALIGASGRRWKGALHTPSDGRAEPANAVPAMARKAEALGARFVTGCAVRAVETEGGHVAGIETERGHVACRAVLCAAGAWSRIFCRNLGVTLPQLRVKGSVLRTTPAPLVTQSAVWCAQISFRRRQDGGYTIAGSGRVAFELVPDAFRFLRLFIPALMLNRQHVRPCLSAEFLRQMRQPARWPAAARTPFEETRVLDPEPDRDVLENAIAAARTLFPAFADVKIAESWAGMIDVTPDALPVMDAVDRPRGLYIATGFSGHGFGMGPGAGLLMSELILNGAARVDLSPFRLSRFFDGTRMEPFAPV